MLFFTGRSVAFGAEVSGFLNKLQSNLDSTNKRISTGKRVNEFRDDPAAYVLSDKLFRDVTALRGPIKVDLANTVGILQVAVSAINDIRDLYDQMTVIAADSASATPSKSRTDLSTEFEALKDEVENTIDSAIYNGVNVLSGIYSDAYGGNNLHPLYSTDVTQQLDIAIHRVTTANLGIDGLFVNFQVNAQIAHDSLTDPYTAGTALRRLNFADSNVSSGDAIAQHNLDSLDVRATNLESAASTLVEADMVYETARQTALEIQKQSALAVVAQSNMSASYILNLFPNLRS